MMVTRKQTLTLELSRARTRLNELAGADELTDETRAELDTLELRYGDLERQFRAAILAESNDEAAAAGLFPDGPDVDGRELRTLIGRVNVSDYLTAAAAGVRPIGRGRRTLRSPETSRGRTVGRRPNTHADAAT